MSMRVVSYGPSSNMPDAGSGSLRAARKRCGSKPRLLCGRLVQPAHRCAFAHACELNHVRPVREVCDEQRRAAVAADGESVQLERTSAHAREDLRPAQPADVGEHVVERERPFAWRTPAGPAVSK